MRPRIRSWPFLLPIPLPYPGDCPRAAAFFHALSKLFSAWPGKRAFLLGKKEEKFYYFYVDIRKKFSYSVFNERGKTPKGENRMNAQRKENIARAIIANRSTAQLCEMFEATNCTSRENLLEEMMVRGWIMDELEKRDAEAFDRWIDCEDPKMMERPRCFFIAA